MKPGPDSNERKDILLTADNDMNTVLSKSDIEVLALSKTIIPHTILHDLIKSYHVFFRFIDDCTEPRAVAGRLCWTTINTQIHVADQNSLTDAAPQILLTYRTADTRQRSSFVPMRNLQNAIPTTKDYALITRGPRQGLVMRVACLIRDPNNVRRVVGAKLFPVGQNKSSATPFQMHSVTRLVLIVHGPP